MKKSEINLKKRILKENIELHEKEAMYYDLLHKEIYNIYEQDRIKKKLKNIIENIPSKNLKILDVGAGTGNMSLKLLKICKNKLLEIDAVDLSREMLEIMKKNIPEKVNVNYYVSHIDHFIKKTKKKYDLIIISSVLHHLPDYEKTLISLFNMLKNNGYIYITHEPLNNNLVKDSFLSKIIKYIDYKLYQARYGYLILTNKIPRLQRDCRYTDYHTGERGLNPFELKKTFYESDIETYSSNYFLNNIINRLESSDTFEMVIRK